MRLKIVRLIVSGLFILIVLELIYVQLIRGRYYYDLSKNNRVRAVPIEGIRGKILDRNGIVLVENRLSLNVMVMPQEIEDVQGLFAFLSKTLNEDYEKLVKRFQQRKFAPFAPVTVAENISREEAISIEENKFLFPGIIVEQSFSRLYPFAEMDAHLLGYVGKISQSRAEKLREYGFTSQSHVGYSGVEEFYDEDLRGEQGGLQIEVNSRGQQVRLLSLKDPSKGKDIVLTIDNRIQGIAQQILGGKAGSIIVMDMDNGEILGLTSAPAYDPNIFVRGLIQNDTANILTNSTAPLMNRAISGQYPPGSVFKVLLALGALESAKISPGTHFLCPGFYNLGKQQFRCSHIHGDQNLIDAITHSCNVYFYQVGRKMGAELIYQYAKAFGLGAVTGIDLPYEVSGNIPSPHQRKALSNRGWYAGDTLNLSIGQGDVLTSPIQLVMMMSTIAQNGRMVHPHVIKSIGETEINRYSAKQYIHFNEENFNVVTDGLKDVVDEDTGTGHLLEIEGLKVSGKTGTAQSSGAKENHAWFVGFSYSGKRNIAFCVFLEHGGSSRNAVELSRELLVQMQQKEIL